MFFGRELNPNPLMHGLPLQPLSHTGSARLAFQWPGLLSLHPHTSR